MKRKQTQHVFRLSCLATVLAGIYGSAGAQVWPEDRADAIAKAAVVNSEISLGAGYVSHDNRRFGQYSGLRDAGLYGLIDLSLVSLNKESGTWTKLYGRNLGLDNRELLLDIERQGNWRYFVGFNQGVRYEPYVVNTALTGIGTTQQTVGTAGGKRPVDLEMTRDQLSAGFDQTFGGNNGFRLRYTHEDKQGARLYGRGSTAAGSPTPTFLEFLTEPISRSTQTLEASMSHTGKTLQVSGGYYGTLFVNHAERLDVVGGAAALSGGATPFTPMSMPLSNDSHQVFLTGGYNVTQRTRATFKTSRTIARQNENFIAAGAPLAGAPTSLNGRVDTTLGYLDLSSFEFDRLDLQANVRYEDRDDKTPLAQYLTAAAPNANLAGTNGFNKPRSWRSLKSKLEAGYQLPMGFKMVGGWELDQQKRNVPEPYRRVDFRAETDEATSRLELKRMLAESVSGSVAYSRAKRTGSDYVADTFDMSSTSAGIQPSAAVNPLIWADRERATWKSSIDWSPLDELSLHASYEHSDDQYSGRAMGPREGKRGFYSVDASYALSDRWQASLWVTQEDTHARQSTQVNPTLASTQVWQANLRQLGQGVGAGLRGKLRSGIELGADVSHHRDEAEQHMTALTGNAINSLPDYYYALTEVRAFTNYPIAADSGVRLDYVYHDWRTNDWTWESWQYSTDQTTLTQDTVQRTHFVGASYYLRWR